MRKIAFLTTTLLLFLVFAVSAQPRDNRERLAPEQQAARTVERLTKELQLTAKQQAELKTWFTTSIKKRQDMMAKNQGNREAMRENAKKDREETDIQMKKVLTADQFKKYKENQEKRMQEMQKRREGQKGAHL